MKKAYLILLSVLLGFNLQAFALGGDGDPIIVWPSDISKSILEVEALRGAWITRLQSETLLVHFKEGPTANTIQVSILDTAEGECIGTGIFTSVGHAYSGNIVYKYGQSTPAIIFANTSGMHLRFFMNSVRNIDLLLLRPKKVLKKRF